MESAKAKGVVNVLFEYLGLCVDWERVVLPGGQTGEEEKEGEVGKDLSRDIVDASGEIEVQVEDDVGLEAKKNALRDAVTLLVAGAINSGISKEAKKAVDVDRAGIAMFRIP